MEKNLEKAKSDNVSLRYQEYKSKKIFTNLDGLRFLSILWVCILHFASASELMIVQNGTVGVQLFFGISGFLITTLLIREREESGKISLRNFYIRRTFRILPLYYITLSFYLFIVLASSGSFEGGARFISNIPVFATFTSNWLLKISTGTIFFWSWSLAAEEQFYLSWPWLEKALKVRPKVIILITAIALIYGYKLELIALPFERESLFWRVLNSLQPSILMGVVSAYLLNSKKSFSFLWGVFGRKVAAPVALSIVLLLGSRYKIFHHKMPISYFELFSQISLICLIISCVIREDNGLQYFLTFKPIARIGVISYGVYMMNTLALHAARKIATVVAVDSRWFIGITAGLLVIFGAEISFRTFERYFMNLRSRLLCSG